MKEFLIILLTGGMGAGLFKLLDTLLDHVLKRKDKSKELIKQEMDVFGQRITDVENLVQNLIYSERVSLKDRIRHIGKTYIREGSISIEEREDLLDLHKAYHDYCNGNGNLDALMADVKKLPLK